MNICLIGNSLTSLILAKSLVNKKIKVTMYYQNKFSMGNNTRTTGISSNNIKFIQEEVIKINKSLLWDINQIEVYNQLQANHKILNFNDSKKKLFFIIKNDKFYKLLYQDLEKNNNFRKILVKNSGTYAQIIKKF